MPNSTYDPYSERAMLKAQLARDLEAFKEAGGKIDSLGIEGRGEQVVSFNGPSAKGNTRLDMSLYYTEGDIVSEGGKRGVLPMGRPRFRERVRRGEYQGPHDHINEHTPVWRKDYIDALALDIQEEADDH